MNESEIPVAHRQTATDLLTSLDKAFGFSISDFERPEASNLDTPYIGWNLRLKNFPKHYFFFRIVSEKIYIKHFPNKTENKERSIELSSRHKTPFEVIKNEALEWLRIIDDGRQIDNKWDELFGSKENSEYTPFEIIEEEPSDSVELTADEIQDIRIFLNAFDDLIQESKTLPQEVKSAYSEVKKEAEIKLDNKPTKAFVKWLKKIFDAIFIKYITDSNYRSEVKGHFVAAMEKIQHLGQDIEKWIRQIGSGSN